MASDIDVQRGTADIGNTGGTTAPGTDFGSLASTLVRANNNRLSHGGPPSSGGNQEGDDMSGGTQLTAVDTITFTREGGSSGNAMRFAWESWEYVGDPGGAYEFIVRSRNTVTLTGTSATATLTNTPTDIDRCIPFITGNRTTDGSDDWDAACSIAWISGSNTLNVARGGTVGTTTVEVTTVEFTGSAWDVKHGRVESPADTGTITLVDDADGVTAGGGDVLNWANAAIFGYFRGNDRNGVDDSISDTSAIYDPGTLTTEVDWQFNAQHADAGTAQDGQHFVHVLACADMTVTRIDNTGNGAGSNNVSIAAAGLTALAEAGSIVRRTSSGGGTAYGRGWVNATLTSTTNCELWVHRSGNTIRTNIQVIDFEGMVDAGAGPQTIDSPGTISSTTLFDLVSVSTPFAGDFRLEPFVIGGHEPVQLLSRRAGGLQDAGGGDAGNWLDLSSSGNDATPADALDPPGYVADPLGDGTGAGALTVNGGSPGYASGIDLSALTDATFWVAYDVTGFGGPSGFPYFLGDDTADGDDWAVYEDSGTIYHWNGSALQFIESAGGAGTYIYVCVKTGTTLDIYKISPGSGTDWPTSTAPIMTRTVATGIYPQDLFYGCFGNDNFNQDGHMLAGAVYDAALTATGGVSSEIGELFDAILDEVGTKLLREPTTISSTTLFDLTSVANAVGAQTIDSPTTISSTVLFDLTAVASQAAEVVDSPGTISSTALFDLTTVTTQAAGVVDSPTTISSTVLFDLTAVASQAAGVVDSPGTISSTVLFDLALVENAAPAQAIDSPTTISSTVLFDLTAVASQAAGVVDSPTTISSTTLFDLTTVASQADGVVDSPATISSTVLFDLTAVASQAPGVVDSPTTISSTVLFDLASVAVVAGNQINSPTTISSTVLFDLAAVASQAAEVVDSPTTISSTVLFDLTTVASQAAGVVDSPTTISSTTLFDLTTVASQAAGVVDSPGTISSTALFDLTAVASQVAGVVDSPGTISNTVLFDLTAVANTTGTVIDSPGTIVSPAPFDLASVDLATGGVIAAEAGIDAFVFSRVFSGVN